MAPIPLVCIFVNLTTVASTLPMMLVQSLTIGPHNWEFVISAHDGSIEMILFAPRAKLPVKVAA